MGERTPAPVTAPSAKEWAEGFLAQARADLHAAKIVTGQEPSAFAMLLQMCFEKFAKAALLRSGAVAVQKATSTHVAASKMVRLLRVQQPKALGGPWPWESVLDVVESLERAHPSYPEVRSRGPHLEYPWASAETGHVCWPAAHLEIARRLGSTSTLGDRVLKFAALLDRNFDEIFPP